MVFQAQGDLTETKAKYVKIDDFYFIATKPEMVNDNDIYNMPC